MISLAEALERVAATARPLGTESLSVANVLSRHLAEDVVSPSEAPRFNKSIMDGFAFASGGETSAAGREFVICGTVAAGDAAVTSPKPGEAVRIMTGAKLPDATDTVVPWEQTESAGDDPTGRPKFRLLRAVGPGSSRLLRGQIVAVGDSVLTAGTRLTPPRQAFLMELGCRKVLVARRPRVAILATGSELRDVGDTVTDANIVNTNGPMLQALLQASGYTTHSLGMESDDSVSLRNALRRGLDCDLLLVTGGVSAGDFDHVPGCLKELGAACVFHGISLKPGKPTWFGQGPGGQVIFGLPGNPLSVYVNYLILVRYACDLLSGRSSIPLPIRFVQLALADQRQVERETFWPARYVSNPRDAENAAGVIPTVELLPWQGSSDLRTLAAADGFIHFPVGHHDRKAHAKVGFLPLDVCERD